MATIQRSRRFVNVAEQHDNFRELHHPLWLDRFQTCEPKNNGSDSGIEDRETFGAYLIHHSAKSSSIAVRSDIISSFGVAASDSESEQMEFIVRYGEVREQIA